VEDDGGFRCSDRFLHANVLRLSTTAGMIAGGFADTLGGQVA
jgi:hypothetical protein